MAGQRASVGNRRAAEAAPITSTVAWLALGLLIEKPSYVYEVFKRFERRYEDLHPISTSRMYAAFANLEQDGLIEAMDADDIPAAGTRRQPKVHYRATARGAAEWKRELVGRFEEESQRPALLNRVLAATALDDAMLVAVLNDLEEHLLDQRDEPIPSPPTGAREPGVTFGTRLASEYQRVVLHAQLMFLDWARAQLKTRKDAE